MLFKENFTQIKEGPFVPVNMGFIRRFFTKRNSSAEPEEDSTEDNMLSKLKEQYQRDIEEDVSTIESILEDDEEELEDLEILPAPDYDEHDATVDDVLIDSEMGNYSEKNVVEHSSIEELGNHLDSATIIGDVSTEVSFDPPE